MKKYYPWLLFDADGTLFDYDRAEGTAFERAFQLVNIPYKVEYLDPYRRINHELWQALERREVTPAVLQVRRFELLLETLALTCSAAQLSTVYLEQLALCTDLIEGADEVLRALQTRSRIAIVTNGLQAVQRSRLARSSIREYITELIISEEIGAAKPKAAYFDITFARLGHPPKSDVLIIGDSLSSDIQGGVTYGLDTCWYNPTGQPRPDHLPITYEITHLRDLLELLE